MTGLRRVFSRVERAIAWALLVAVLLGNAGYAQSSGGATLGNNQMKLPTLAQTMNWDSCFGYFHAPPVDVPWFGKSCCIPLVKGQCLPGFKGKWAPKIEYWEPSAMIEVSCRNGWSAIAPGKVAGRGQNVIQSCYGAGNANKAGKWFFEARVWALNGGEGQARYQSSGGSNNGMLARQCEEEGDDTGKHNIQGYGVKWDKFSRGAANGPGGSWEAYISDKDPTWAQDSGGVSTPPNQQACKEGDVDVEKCWGPLNGGGWVTGQPNQAVAAALVAWRAHTKALNSKKVSPSSKGYKINMDYPFIKSASPFAQSMGGFSGGSYRGSRCFKPGDAGPYWYTNNEQQLTPDKVPGFIQNLQAGNGAAPADIHPGVYIFTVWAYTSCTRYKIENKKPTPFCKYGFAGPSD